MPRCIGDYEAVAEESVRRALLSFGLILDDDEKYLDMICPGWRRRIKWSLKRPHRRGVADLGQAVGTRFLPRAQRVSAPPEGASTRTRRNPTRARDRQAGHPAAQDQVLSYSDRNAPPSRTDAFAASSRHESPSAERISSARLVFSHVNMLWGVRPKWPYTAVWR